VCSDLEANCLFIGWVLKPCKSPALVSGGAPAIYAIKEDIFLFFKLEPQLYRTIRLCSNSAAGNCRCTQLLADDSGRLTGKPEVTRLGREERNVREKGSSPQQWKRQIPNPQPNPQERPSFVTSAYFGSPPRCCMLLYNLITQRCDGRGRFSMQVHDGLTLRSTSFCLDMYGNVCGRRTIRLWILFPRLAASQGAHKCQLPTATICATRTIPRKSLQADGDC